MYMLPSCSRDHDLGDGSSVSYGTVLLIQYIFGHSHARERASERCRL
jgi:hypothetical protein